jgi:hypothetical protein
VETDLQLEPDKSGYFSVRILEFSSLERLIHLWKPSRQNVQANECRTLDKLLVLLVARAGMAMFMPKENEVIRPSKFGFLS